MLFSLKDTTKMFNMLEDQTYNVINLRWHYPSEQERVQTGSTREDYQRETDCNAEDETHLDDFTCWRRREAEHQISCKK